MTYFYRAGDDLTKYIIIDQLKIKVYTITITIRIYTYYSMSRKCFGSCPFTSTRV